MRMSMVSIRAIGVATCLAAAGPALADYPFGTPKARTGASDEVSVGEAQKIALKKARDVWGKVAPGSALPCVDEDGDLVAYMFPFAIGVASFPSYEDLSPRIKRGRRIAEAGYDAMTDAEKQELQDYVHKHARQGAALDANPDAPMEGLGPATDLEGMKASAKKFGRDATIGADRFGTVVVSARRDRFPIPLYTSYLPPYLYQGDLALERASAAGNATLERIYFLEHRRGQYFELSAPGGSVLVNSYSLEVEPAERVLVRKGRKVSPEPEALRRIAEEWKKAAANAQ